MTKSFSLSFWFTGAMFLLLVSAKAQSLYKVSLEEKISRSSLILEGKVVAKRSFWNEAHTMIYTANTVEVYKIFKGSMEKGQIEVITVGGAVDNQYIHASHQLELSDDDVGMFFCAPVAGSQQRYKVYSSSQGFLKYNIASRMASAPFTEYHDIEKQLYTELTDKIGQRVQVKNSLFNVEKEARKFDLESKSVLAPSISGFSPTAVYAGALSDPENNVLTITGTGFGTGSGQAAVLFPDVDKTPGSFVTIGYNHRLMVSWSNTQIRVRVPSSAAQGAFQVRDNSGSTVNSGSDLIVPFSVLSAELLSPYFFKQFNLGNRNNQGGYTVKYSTNTANSGINVNTSPAKETFQRALNTWRESVGANIIEGGTTNIQAVNTNDNENVIMFDNGGTGLDERMESGVLATCYSGLTVCANDPANNQAIKTGFDIVIRNMGYSSGSTTFTFGPCPPYSLTTQAVDLESVLLHELGHALNLAHTRDQSEGTGPGTTNPSGVMNYSVSLNHRRISLDNSAKDGAEYLIAPKSYTWGTCVTGNPNMEAIDAVVDPHDDCPVNFPTTTTTNNSTVNFNLSRTSSNRIADPGYTQMSTNGTPTSVTNTAFYPVRTNNSGGDLRITVSNYTTRPEAIAACPTGSSGIDISGVKLAVYRVSECPAGGSFPAPIANYSFDANGSLPTLQNLQRRTSYLLVLDGVQNTKAAFDLNLEGPAILERITTLSGTVLGDNNQLSWNTDTLFGIESMRLERSPDSVNFVQIKSITSDEQDEGSHTDNEPLPGTNYYRIAIDNTDGTTDYTAIVVLSRSNILQVTLQQNPVVANDLVLSVTNNSAQNYSFTIQNALGQVLITRQQNLAGGRQTVRIPVQQLARGQYFLAIYSGQDRRAFKTVRFSKMQ